MRSIRLSALIFSAPPPSPAGETRRRSTMACQAHTMSARPAMLRTSLTMSASHVLLTASQGIDQAHPSGVQPTIRPTLTGIASVVASALVTNCIPTPSPQHRSTRKTIMVSRNRRLASTADIAASRRFDAIMAPDHPSRTPSTAATTAIAPALDHATTCEAAATRVTIPPIPNRPAVTNAGISSRGRLGNMAYREGSV